nr:hypothetical protein [Candidatus Sigynarchaeota archaeon]
MSERSLENFLKKLEDEKKEVDNKEENKLAILQGVVEKILNYVFSSMEMTSNRIVNLESGIGNITSYLSQQLNDLTGRLRQLPGMQGLKDIQVPAVDLAANPATTGNLFFQNLAQFIAQKAVELQTIRSQQPSAKPTEITEEEAEVAEPDEFSGGLNEEFLQKTKELEAREKYLSKLSEQLASKEQLLQERENTIEILETGMQDKLKLSAAMKMVSQDKKGEKGEKTGETSDELAELSKLSESIIQGDKPDDSTQGDENGVDEETLKNLVENDDEPDDDKT